MDGPRVRKSEYVVVSECVLPDLPPELRDAVASAMASSGDDFGDAGDPSELVVRFDNKEEAIEFAGRMKGAVYRLGPQVWPTPGKEPKR